jgi:hypothetical protein
MKLLLTLGMFLMLNSLFGQTIMPAAKSFKPFKERYIPDQEKIKNDIKNNNAAFNRTFATLFTKTPDERKPKVTDSARKVYADSLYKAQLQELADTLNHSSPVTPIVTGGLANLENSKKSYGSLSFGLQYRLSKYKITKKKWIDPQYIYVIFSSKTATSPDSSVIQKTFMFPELNKRDFVLGYFW